LTTLLDPVAYPAEALAELYLQRWQVELHFREREKPAAARRVTLPFAADDP
jgi:IS4 transposase